MNIFSYDSKFNQTLQFVADLAIMNILFVLCCLPIFTIGAAQAALHSAMRTLLDPEDDESPSKVFFRSFRTGFKSITAAWGLFFLAETAMLVVFYYVVGFGQTIGGAPVWMCLAALGVMILLQSQIPLFHSRFNCTAPQLLRNCFMMVFAHPIRSILVMVLLWAPVAAFLLIHSVYFLMISLTFILLYYAVAAMLSYYIMKKPFQVLVDHYKDTHDKDGNPILMTLNEEGELVKSIMNPDGTFTVIEEEVEEEEEE